jgi:hypothetical protein
VPECSTTPHNVYAVLQAMAYRDKRAHSSTARRCYDSIRSGPLGPSWR